MKDQMLADQSVAQEPKEVRCEVYVNSEGWVGIQLGSGVGYIVAGLPLNLAYLGLPPPKPETRWEERGWVRQPDAFATRFVG